MQSPLALVRDRASDGSNGSNDHHGQDDVPHAHDEARAPEFDALEHRVGVNLARLRAERQLSLDALARASGVSRAMLAQIESARSVPSIKVLCKVAAALKVSVAAFLRQHAVNGFEHLPADSTARVVTSNGRFWTRALYPDAEPSTAEFHELRIAPLHTEAGTRRAPGTTVNLVVSVGAIEVSVHERRQLLATGDSIVFDADQPHSLRNPGDTEARAFRVTVNAETPPRWAVAKESAKDVVTVEAPVRAHSDA
ncbi:XRE family transcriptional regulator [Paraburkholderia diazotrophica]|uniref:helix-turn-helix domain-containing protein n=1 Tax=Paraburkholderia diazotrophica TaxID=667676 RepID=UPI003171768B